MKKSEFLNKVLDNIRAYTKLAETPFMCIAISEELYPYLHIYKVQAAFLYFPELFDIPHVAEESAWTEATLNGEVLDLVKNDRVFGRLKIIQHLIDTIGDEELII